MLLKAGHGGRCGTQMDQAALGSLYLWSALILLTPLADQMAAQRLTRLIGLWCLHCILEPTLSPQPVETLSKD